MTTLNNFCYKHTLLNRAVFKSQCCTCDLNSKSQTSALLSENALHHLHGNSWCSASAGTRAEPCSQAVPAFGRRRGISYFDSLYQVLSHISTAWPRQPRVALGCLDLGWSGALGCLCRLAPSPTLRCTMALPSKGGSHKQSLCSPAGSDFTPCSKAFLQLKADFYLPHQVAYGVLLPAGLCNPLWASVLQKASQCHK